MDDIKNDATVKFLFEKVDEYNIGNRLVIELTEDEELTHPENIRKVKCFMKRLSLKRGCKFALDDFGKGYATFDPLVHLKFDYIKLDRVLTKDFLEDERKFYLINQLSEYAKRVKMKIIAEYIEKEEEKIAMEYMKVDYLQGYYLHKPEI